MTGFRARGPDPVLGFGVTLSIQGSIGFNTATVFGTSAKSVAGVAGSATGTNGSAATIGLTDSYFPSEGQLIAAPLGPGVRWQTMFQTVHGTIISWAVGDHGHGQVAECREYNPSTKIESWNRWPETYGYPNNSNGSGQQYSLTPNGPNFPMGSRPTNPHDNFAYWYINAIDSLVIPTRGVFHRPSNSWTHADRTEVLSTDGTFNGSYINPGATSVFDGRPLGWASGSTGAPVVGTNAASIIRPGNNVAADGDGFGNHYNPHFAWSPQFDCGVRIGGAPGGGSGSPPMPYMWFIAPSHLWGSYPQPYLAHRKDLPATVDGTRTPWLHEGRNACCFVGPYVYWVGGGYPLGVTPSMYRPWFFRCDVRPHLASTSPTTVNNIEVLPDAPFAHSFGLLMHDPYSNTLLLVCDKGVARFDLASLAWTTITPAGYVSDYGGAQYLPYDCLGAFVDRVVATGEQKRQFYWRAGGTDNPVAQQNSDTMFLRMRAIKVSRVGSVSYITNSTANPENPSLSNTPMMRSIKHHALRVVGSGSTRRLYLAGGDYTGYPFGTLANVAGYPPESIQYAESGRQDVWAADISDTALAAGGDVRFKLVGNAYHNYPWTGSGGYFGPGRPGGGVSPPQRGPYIPDACAFTSDGSDPEAGGRLWMGPIFNDNTQYLNPASEIAGYEGATYGGNSLWAPIYKWTKPGVNTSAYGVAGVALGNTWELPAQDRLQAVRGMGTQGVEWDVPITFGGTSVDSSSIGWGRVNINGTVFDPVNNQLVTLIAGGSGSAKAFYFKLYKFGLTQVGGKHPWTTSAIITVPVQSTSPGIPDSAYTSIAMDWGDDGRGTIAMAPQLIGRRMFVTIVGVFRGVSDAKYKRLEPNGRSFGKLFAINLDTLAVEHIPFPESQDWWVRAYDGPDATTAYNAVPSQHPLTPAQYRSMVVVNNKLVLGPDSYHKIGVDPWIQVYDTTTKNWTSFQPPADSEYGNAAGNFVAVPEIGEVWIAGNYNGLGASEVAWLQSMGMWAKPAQTDVGNRIVRFVVDTPASSYYTTSFAATEPTISEGGKWINGGTTGQQWKNVATAGGNAIASAFVGQGSVNYDDSIAVLNTSFTANQYATGTVYKVGGYAPSVTHEIELLLRFQITANSARGYEVLWNTAGAMAVVRWNGPIDNYTDLTPYGVGNALIGVPVTGDVLRAQIVGNVITVYKNGVQVFQVDITAVSGSVWTSGQPGIGFFPRVGATLASYGWSDFGAGSL